MTDDSRSPSSSQKDSDQSSNSSEDSTASEDFELGDDGPASGRSDHRSVEELREVVDDLRAEITRLKAQQARSHAGRSWVQRHPGLAVVLAAGIGSAAGYGVAQAVRSRRPRSLSNQAQKRLARLGRNIARLAGRLREEWSEWGAERRQAVENRLMEAGRQLAQEAEAAGSSAREGTRAVTERAREAGEKASKTLRAATDEATRQLGSKATEELPTADVLPDDAEKSLRSTLQAATNSTSSSNGRKTKSALSWLMAVGGIAVGGYLASKVRRWL